MIQKYSLTTGIALREIFQLVLRIEFSTVLARWLLWRSLNTV
jgi:hypothetical protein